MWKTSREQQVQLGFSDARALWDECSDRLRESLPPSAWMSCIQELVPLDVQEGRLQLAAPSPLVKQRFDGEYRPAVLLALSSVAGAEMDVSVTLVEPGDATDDDAPLPATLPIGAPGKVDGAGLNPDHTFESFVTGANNRFAAAAAMAVAEAPAKSYNPLFVYGGVGLGKTHLLHAIGHLARKIYPQLGIRYVSTEEFTNHFIQSIRHRDLEAFKRSYRSTDILLVDDIQFLEGKEETQEEFFHTFNSLRERGSQIVITSDCPPKALATLEDRLRTRFEWGLITDIQPPDFETRMAILRYKSESSSYPMPDEVLSYIAHRVEDNIRELEGALTRIRAYGSINNRPVSVGLADEVLAGLFPERGSECHQIDPGTIIAASARHFGMPAAAILGGSRTRPLVLARHVAMYLCREHTDLSLVEIGKVFGRDHTTVMYGIEKITELMATRPTVYQSVQAITQRVKKH
jgi:chromosomal replication initiator protein